MLALLGVLVWANLERMAGGIDAFLSYRVSLKNILLLGLFAFVWRLIFRWAGLYGSWRIRQFSSEASRVIGACSIGTLIAMPFPFTSASGAFKYHHLFYFWLASTGTTLLVQTAPSPAVPTQIGRGTAPRPDRRHRAAGAEDL